ncbi:uncharacterized protein LOC125757895 [Rhipicephalus sanguineus]|uniref:uncharacterized protein LOC125757895 n=1 Tax=Rhipicephalus sanguineus TaxID=34632 RepID=UPI0020C4A634|nr:uncharacterized protein LOC125757895 [Rhipicephalus sanguineus]
MTPDVTGTCVYLENIYNSQALQSPKQQLILAIEKDNNSLEMLSELAERSWWFWYRSLTIAPLPRRDPAENYAIVHPVGTACMTSLLNLIAAFTNLTELNLTFCHFDRGLDWRDIVASGTFLKIRALSLAQCALTIADSVEALASSCPLLEELDVRALSITWTEYYKCESSCQPSVSFNRDTVKTLCERTRLQRLTLLDISQRRCLHWLSQVRLVQLRLDWLPVPCCLTKHMVRWLSVNQHLRSITLRPLGVAFRDVCAEVRKTIMPSLRALTIISSAYIYRESVLNEVSSTLSHLPALQTFHVHFPALRCQAFKLTWTRRSPLCVETVQQDVPSGDFIFHAPCPRDCSMDTFIGLIKPHS